MIANQEPAPFPAARHDHARCVAQAFERAEKVCATRGVRLTALRRAVLKIVWESHSPIGAYDILDRLRDAGRRAAPVTVYRALDFLMANRLVHRLASQNAYLGCDHPGEVHGAQFLICRACGAAGEIHDDAIAAAIAQSAAETGFRVEAPVVEITGLCPRCDSRKERSSHDG
ncbi:MAG: Fur family transcriptional regulator [Gammaproteobacteria bacterium]|jgi:Fur family zinc uptake transcriptional regulator